MPSSTDFSKLGVYEYAALKQLAGSLPPELVEGLIAERSVNILVGDSGLGKTPLAVTLGVAVASGVPFLGRKVRQGRVLYCDSETPLAEFPRMLESISQTMGLPAPPPDFWAYPLNAPEDETSTCSAPPCDSLIKLVQEMKPGLVVVDPLRTFWPQAPKDAEMAIRMINQLRQLSKQVGCAWQLLHHRRKHNSEGTVALADDPHGWLQEAAGSQALINHTDARLGVEPTPSHPTAELLLAGFVRGKGQIPPIYLAREYDADTGEPTGYQALVGLALLPETYQRAFLSLKNQFRFKDVFKALGGSSGSNAKAFIDRCLSLGLTKRDGKGYVKVMESME